MKSTGRNAGISGGKWGVIDRKRVPFGESLMADEDKGCPVGWMGESAGRGRMSGALFHDSQLGLPQCISLGRGRGFELIVKGGHQQA